MRAWVGVTDNSWFELLSNIPGLTEVNFWQPGGKRVFKTLEPKELFLFKLHSPLNFIVGGGIFAYSTIVPISIAWESFGQANGARDLIEMKKRVSKYRRETVSLNEDYKIGCILLEQPFFLPRKKWIPIPFDWRSNIVQGKTYDLTVEPGLSILRNLQTAGSLTHAIYDNTKRYGKPTTVLPRLGQGSFRIIVTDAYERRCALTNERTLPALDAAHIKPFALSGENEISNGILMRKDLHALFDRGYITINPSLKIEVSRKIRDEFENGRDYYRLHGNKIREPVLAGYKPSRESIDWHNNHVYLG
jgi:putative restriction endonuclease